MAKGSKKSVEEMFADISAQLSNLTPLVEKVQRLTDNVSNLEKMIKEIKDKNATLKKDLADLDSTIDALQIQLNDVQ